MSIYVETLIRAPLDELWKRTQMPELHERWDLRFSSIEYLPRATDAEPQRFRYLTRLGFGTQVAGDGETVGERDLVNGSRSSALRFRSADWRSIILEGSGYWKYVPTAEGVRFLTRYDYRTRYGKAGRLFDRIVFGPLIGWATAWSFDRLRLWLERGIDPEQAVRDALVHGMARVGLAATFAYQGLVPKLLFRHSDEVALLAEAGIAADAIGFALFTIGIAELVLAVCSLAFWHRRWPAIVSLALMAAATIDVAVNSPDYLAAAFNPISLNLAVACLAAIDLLVLSGVPSATRCRRRPAGVL
jgi:hypothetical protein